MAGPDLGFHRGNLRAAAGDSCCTLLPFRRDLLEGPPGGLLCALL
jgi:hypothetical protein